MFLVLSPVQAVCFLVVHQGLFGLYMGCSFAPANHKGMPVFAEDDNIDFLRRQVLTSRNIRLPVHRFRIGDPNYQIEHHLFPSMPRPSLRHAQELVRTFCARHGIAYYAKQPHSTPTPKCCGTSMRSVAPCAPKWSTEHLPPVPVDGHTLSAVFPVLAAGPASPPKRPCARSCCRPALAVRARPDVAGRQLQGVEGDVGGGALGGEAVGAGGGGGRSGRVGLTYPMYMTSGGARAAAGGMLSLKVTPVAVPSKCDVSVAWPRSTSRPWRHRAARSNAGTHKIGARAIEDSHTARRATRRPPGASFSVVITAVRTAMARGSSALTPSATPSATSSSPDRRPRGGLRHADRARAPGTRRSAA